MGTILFALIGAIGGLVIGAAVIYVVLKGRTAEQATESHVENERLLAEAQAQQKEIILEAKDEAHRIREAAALDARERRADVQRMERRVQQKEENLDRKLEGLERRERQLGQREEEIERPRELRQLDDERRPVELLTVQGRARVRTIVRAIRRRQVHRGHSPAGIGRRNAMTESRSTPNRPSAGASQ